LVSRKAARRQRCKVDLAFSGFTRRRQKAKMQSWCCFLWFHAKTPGSKDASL